MNSGPQFDVATVTPNPAIDRTLTIPEFATGSVNRVEREYANPGGKGVNAASLLADYGLRVAVTGFLGYGNPALFEAQFRQKKIADHFVRIPGETRVSIKISDPVSHETTDINFAGSSPTEGEVAALEKQLTAIHSEWFLLAGSLPPDIDAGVYAHWITALKAQGKRVVLDTSGAPLAAAVQAAPQIVKPNVHELEGLLGRMLSDEAGVIEAARTLLQKGVEMATVSMGSRGACFVTESETVIARPPELEVRTTVGAGDAMAAGIIAAQLAGLDLAECARLATAFSLAALSRDEGASTSRSQIEDWLPKVDVIHWKF